MDYDSRRISSRGNNNIEVVFKNCAPFTDCICEINNSIVYRLALVWKSIIFTFCFIKSWCHFIKVSAQTFSTTSCKKSDINMRPSDLYDNLTKAVRFHKNNYTVRTTRV